MPKKFSTELDTNQGGQEDGDENEGLTFEDSSVTMGEVKQALKGVNEG